MIEITREIAAKVLSVVDVGLVGGLGNPEPGEMCVEAAVCYALGLPHGDNPDCVAPTLRALKIRLNDAAWSSKKARTKGLRRLAVAQLGSAGALDEHEFVRRIVDYALRRSTSSALRFAATVQNNAEHRQKLLDAAARCESDGTQDAAKSAAAAAAAAADAAAANAAYAASANASASAAAAADAAYAASANASAAAAAAAAYAAANAADAYAAADARDKSLAAYAEDIVQILIDMKAPGCQWLDLTEMEL